MQQTEKAAEKNLLCKPYMLKHGDYQIQIGTPRNKTKGKENEDVNRNS
tara:strand:+ start:210 stop:353 length:144 start_codon:yes stop_codon:yes gene_type:complete